MWKVSADSGLNDRPELNSSCFIVYKWSFKPQIRGAKPGDGAANGNQTVQFRFK